MTLGHHKKPKDEDVLVVGGSFDFWINDEDDIYDEVYGERSPNAGGSNVDDKQLLDAIREIVRDEVSHFEERFNQRMDSLEQHLNKRMETLDYLIKHSDILEQAVLETDRDVRKVKNQLDETVTDVKLMKKLAAK